MLQAGIGTESYSGCFFCGLRISDACECLGGL